MGASQRDQPKRAINGQRKNLATTKKIMIVFDYAPKDKVNNNEFIVI